MCAFDREPGSSSSARRRVAALCALAPLTTSSVLLLHRDAHVSDAATGLMVGVSFGVAIVGLIRVAGLRSQ